MTRSASGFAAFAVTMLAGSFSWAQQVAPAARPVVQPVVQPSASEPKAKPKVYDESADGKKQIEAALAKAKKNNRRVLVQWGANWCGWCVKMHGLFKADREIAKELLYEYDVVYIDVGRFDKHMDLATAYGADLKANGLPFLTILDADGKPLANQETGSLVKKPEADKDNPAEHDPAAVLALLAKHQAAHPEAKAVLDAAMAEAKKDGKQVFVHFGAPWCGWCHRLEDWMARPEIAAILAKEFVDCKIDVDRTKNSAAVTKQFGKDDKGGIPWFCFVAADGTKNADSDGPQGNVGFPAAPEEIEHFKAMLTKSVRKMSSGDVEALAASLREKK